MDCRLVGFFVLFSLVTLVSAKIRGSGSTLYRTYTFTPEQQQLMVAAHNYYRSLEPASNMQEMVWDDRLAMLAGDWASNCDAWHRPGMERMMQASYRYVGENIWWSSERGLRANLDSMARDWYAIEKPYYNFDNAWCPPGLVCGHYTQMVWAETCAVGCAASYCDGIKNNRGIPNGHIVICNYGPGGNKLRTRPYIKGPNCASCPGQCRNGLCPSKCSGRSAKPAAFPLYQTPAILPPRTEARKSNPWSMRRRPIQPKKPRVISQSIRAQSAKSQPLRSPAAEPKRSPPARVRWPASAQQVGTTPAPRSRSVEKVATSRSPPFSPPPVRSQRSRAPKRAPAVVKSPSVKVPPVRSAPKRSPPVLSPPNRRSSPVSSDRQNTNSVSHDRRKFWVPAPEDRRVTFTVSRSESEALGCKDEYSNCPRWKHRGECKRNPSFMRSRCKISCDACNTRTKSTNDNIDTSKDENSLRKCEDRHRYCMFWQSKGECQRNHNWMQHYCFKACNFKKC